MLLLCKKIQILLIGKERKSIEPQTIYILQETFYCTATFYCEYNLQVIYSSKIPWIIGLLKVDQCLV